MKNISAEEFDLMFEEDGDVLQYCDLDNPVVSVGGKRQEGRRRVNVDMSGEMIARLDAQAARHDVPRQALIKIWLVERLTKKRSVPPAARRKGRDGRLQAAQEAQRDVGSLRNVRELPQDAFRRDAFRQVGREGRGGQVHRLPPRERLRVLHLPFVKRCASVVSASLFAGPCTDAALPAACVSEGANGCPGVVGMNPRCAGDILPRNGYNTASGARGSLNL